MENVGESGRDRMKAMISFLSDVLFDADTQEQFFEECKELGITEEEDEDTN